MEQTIDTQLAARFFRYLLDQEALRRAGRSGQRLPIFLELEQYVNAILPVMEVAYDQLATVGRLWATHGVDQILAATAPDQIPLGQGTITAGEWLLLQRVFKAIPAMLETPIVLPDDPEGSTPGPVPVGVISVIGRGV